MRVKWSLMGKMISPRKLAKERGKAQMTTEERKEKERTGMVGSERGEKETMEEGFTGEEEEEKEGRDEKEREGERTKRKWENGTGEETREGRGTGGRRTPTPTTQRHHCPGNVDAKGLASGSIMRFKREEKKNDPLWP